MGKVVLYSTVSVDGFIAGEHDQPGPLFDWLSSGDVPLDETGQLTVSQASYEHTRAYWDEIGVTIVGRHVFDLTDGWGGTPPSGIDHVVVVSHRAEQDEYRLRAEESQRIAHDETRRLLQDVSDRLAKVEKLLDSRSGSAA
jgi:hypothetical protein